jgi:peptide deformylase
MKKASIVQFGDPVLRTHAKQVTVFHKKLINTVEIMQHTLLNTENSAALAANQIAVLKRIVVINYMDEYIEMINPEILDLSGECIDYEGCLSLPGYSGKVKRAEDVKVKFQNRFGEEIVFERTGAMARCIQHEFDHLNGVLYIDRVVEDFVTDDETKEKRSIEELKRLTSTQGQDLH